MSRSFLFPVPLLGIGTPDVEALSSYLCRLSAAHRAPIGVLLRCGYEWRRSMAARVDEIPYLARNPGSLAQYVRPNEMTRSVLEMLAATTGEVNLQSGTFMCLDGALDRCMKTFHQSIRWCPRCLQEFITVGAEPYFKLAWFVGTTIRCSVHGEKLEARCTHCGSHQNGFGMRRSCATCAHCGRSLASNGSGVQVPGTWRVDGADMKCLLAQIASNPDCSFPEGGVKRALEGLLDKAWREDSAAELWNLVPRDELLSITCNVTPVTLAIVRRLAFRLGVNVDDLLAGSIGETPGVLSASWSERLPSAIKPKRRPPRHNVEGLRKSLNAELRRPRAEPPPPLAEVARTLCVTSGCIRYHFPIHAQELLMRYESWRKREAMRKRSAVMLAVSGYLDSNPLSEVSAKGALRHLRRTTNLPKDLLRQEIATALSVLQLLSGKHEARSSGAIK